MKLHVTKPEKHERHRDLTCFTTSTEDLRKALKQIDVWYDERLRGIQDIALTLTELYPDDIDSILFGCASNMSQLLWKVHSYSQQHLERWKFHILEELYRRGELVLKEDK